MDAHLAELVKQVLDSQHTINEKKVLLNELRKLGGPEENRWHFRYVIWTLALVALSIPIVVLWSMGKGGVADAPSGLLSLGSAAVGALAAFLTPTSRKKDPDSSATTSRLTAKPENSLLQDKSTLESTKTSSEIHEHRL